MQTIVQGQATIVTELRKMSISIDNLSQQIGRLAQINNNGNNSKKSSLNQSVSDFSKHSGGTAIYVRRNEAKNTDKKEDNTYKKRYLNQKLIKLLTLGIITK